jgi:TPP-dependent 2-oxoacid decarboxylase
MSITLQTIVIELVKQAMLDSVKLTYPQLTRLVEGHPEYNGQSKGKALERRIREILNNEDVLQQLREEAKSGDYVSGGFKIGRLEIKGKLDLS